MNKSDFEFWHNSALSWASMVDTSSTFIKYDIKLEDYDSALEQIEIIRKKLANLSECIKACKACR